MTRVFMRLMYSFNGNTFVRLGKTYYRSNRCYPGVTEGIKGLIVGSNGIDNINKFLVVLCTSHKSN